MKKFFTLLCSFIVVLALSGCISNSLTDGSQLATVGIQYTTVANDFLDEAQNELMTDYLEKIPKITITLTCTDPDTKWDKLDDTKKQEILATDLIKIMNAADSEIYTGTPWLKDYKQYIVSDNAEEKEQALANLRQDPDISALETYAEFQDIIKAKLNIVSKKTDPLPEDVDLETILESLKSYYSLNNNPDMQREDIIEIRDYFLKKYLNYFLPLESKTTIHNGLEPTIQLNAEIDKVKQTISALQAYFENLNTLCTNKFSENISSQVSASLTNIDLLINPDSRALNDQQVNSIAALSQTVAGYSHNALVKATIDRDKGTIADAFEYIEKALDLLIYQLNQGNSDVYHKYYSSKILTLYLNPDSTKQDLVTAYKGYRELTPTLKGLNTLRTATDELKKNWWSITNGELYGTLEMHKVDPTNPSGKFYPASLETIFVEINKLAKQLKAFKDSFED